MEGKLHATPILFSENQLQQMIANRLIVIHRNGQSLTVGKKGCTSRLAKLMARKEELLAAIAVEKSK